MGGYGGIVTNGAKCLSPGLRGGADRRAPEAQGPQGMSRVQAALRFKVSPVWETASF